MVCLVRAAPAGGPGIARAHALTRARTHACTQGIPQTLPLLLEFLEPYVAAARKARTPPEQQLGSFASHADSGAWRHAVARAGA